MRAAAVLQPSGLSSAPASRAAQAAPPPALAAVPARAAPRPQRASRPRPQVAAGAAAAEVTQVRSGCSHACRVMHQTHPGPPAQRNNPAVSPCPPSPRLAGPHLRAAGAQGVAHRDVERHQAAADAGGGRGARHHHHPQPGLGALRARGSRLGWAGCRRAWLGRLRESWKAVRAPPVCLTAAQLSAAVRPCRAAGPRPV